MCDRGEPEGTSFWRVLARGLGKRCPRCGRGRLFWGWIGVAPSCEACKLVYLDEPGDPWAFFVLVDRAFILLLVVIIYFRLWPRVLAGVVALFLALTALFIVTTPNRLGLCLGLVYEVRRRWGTLRFAERFDEASADSSPVEKKIAARRDPSRDL